MKKVIIFFGLFLVTFTSISQTSFKNTVLIMPKGKSVDIKINGEKRILDSSYLCNKTSFIEVIKGEIYVLTSNGNELIFTAGKAFKVSKTKASSFPLTKISRYLNKPSVYLPNLSNNERSNTGLFPSWSKIAIKENVRFYSLENFNKKASFSVFLNTTDSMVCLINTLAKEIVFDTSILKEGESYYWKLYNGSNSQKGRFTLLTKSQYKQLNVSKLSKKQTYIHTFFIYLENECFLDAVATLKKAKKNFPESKIFSNLLSKIPYECSKF